MDFKDSIRQLGERISKLKHKIQTEEATKNAFARLRGYCLAAIILIGSLGCSEKAPEPKVEVPVVNEEIINTLQKNNLTPSSPEDITYLGFIGDSINYKIAGGKKKDHAWLSKFTPEGEEIFSFELKSIPGFAFSHSNNKSPYLIDENLLFVVFWATNSSNPNEISFDYASVLTIIDFTTGKELCRLASAENIDKYTIFKEPHLFLIEEGKGVINKLHAINKNGAHLWSREARSLEQEHGMRAYNGYYFLDEDKVIFNSNVVIGNFTQGVYRVIDLKNYNLLFDVLKPSIPFIGEKSNEENITYLEDSIYMNADVIRICYSENERTKIIDDAITNSYHYEYRMLARYYYDINLDGEILRHGKI